ncbi:unnamed protein product [Ectocarpus sp. CCAP 1310/34]|nr:unnamed protein product [Ectocarpus sp. CCAP 1310/34]
MLVEYSDEEEEEEEEISNSGDEQRQIFGPEPAPLQQRSRWSDSSSGSDEASDDEVVEVAGPAARGRGKGAAGEADPFPPLPVSMQRDLTDWLKPSESSTKARERAAAKRARDRAATVVDNAKTSTAPAKNATITRERSFVSNESRREAYHANKKPKSGAKPFKHKPQHRVSPLDRVKEFPGQGLVRLDNGKLGCSVCNFKELQLKWSNVRDHCRSHRHTVRLAAEPAKKAEDEGTLRAFGIMSKAKGGMYGDTLSDRDKLLQVKLVAGCLSAGIPLHALEDPQMKAFFDFANIRAPGRSHLAKHVPFLLRKEVP